MSQELSWEERNGRFLSAGLSRLRLLLTEQAERAEHRMASEPGIAATVEPVIPTPSAAVPSAAAENVSRSAAEMTSLAGTDPPPALVVLANRLGLSGRRPPSVRRDRARYADRAVVRARPG